MRNKVTNLKRIIVKLHESRETFETFMLIQFLYKSDGCKKLLSEMSPKDTEEFPFDVRRVDWF